MLVHFLLAKIDEEKNKERKDARKSEENSCVLSQTCREVGTESHGSVFCLIQIAELPFEVARLFLFRRQMGYWGPWL